jgi:type I restriction enzyme R subunit
MSIQSERELENNLIKDLQALNYKFKEIENETELLENFKEVFEFHNFKQLQKAGIKELSKREFDKILNILNESSVFECARRLRDKFSLELDNGEKVWLEFLNMDDWCQNEFQVSHQITNE